jgi:hypothetical protein
MAGPCEHGDEHSSSGATELVRTYSLIIFYACVLTAYFYPCMRK